MALFCGFGLTSTLSMATATKRLECSYHLALRIAVVAHGFNGGDPAPYGGGHCSIHFYTVEFHVDTSADCEVAHGIQQGDNT